MNAVKQKLFLLLFSCSLIGFGQDTLFLKDKQKLVVLVKEVSQTEIQYKKFAMQDGPMYITSKNDVEKIIYKNGYAEVFKTETAPSGNDFVVYGKENSNINTDKIVYTDTKRRRSSLISLIERHPEEKRKPDLLKMASSLRGLKGGQDATRTVGIIFGGITIATGMLTGLIYSFDSNSGQAFAIVPLAFGTVALISTAVAVTLHVKLKKKRHEFVNLYNQ